MTLSKDIQQVCYLGISLIDNTSLNLNDSPEGIDSLIQSSISSEPYTAAVCVYPKFVKQCKKALLEIKEEKTTDHDSSRNDPIGSSERVQVATVVNFPLGTDSLEEVVVLTKQAVADGADEIDMVIDYTKILEKREEGLEDAAKLVKAIADVCSTGAVLLKVIIESGRLADPDLIYAASTVAIDNGADFIKTSTGKVPVNATVEAARVMLTAIKDWKAAHPESQRVIGFKAAGGVKTVQQTGEYLQLAEGIMGEGWVSKRTFRFGASSLLTVLRDGLKGATDGMATATAGY